MNIKKIIQYFIAIILLTILPSTLSVMEVSANEFKDIPVNHAAASAVQWASSRGIIGGYNDGTFRPRELVTEGQFAVMLTRYYEDIRTEASTYKQLDEKVWSNSSYEALARYQVPLLGYLDHTYRNKPITRGLLAQVIAHVNGQPAELEGAIQYLFDEKITSGQIAQAPSLLDKYGHKNDLTRAQVVIFFHRINEQGKNELAEKIVANKSAAVIGSLEAENVKKQSVRMVDSRVKPVEIVNSAGYIEGQPLPAKPTYVNGILIVNKKNPLPQKYAPGENKLARKSFNEMAVVAKKSGIRLTTVSTYRSFDYQTTLYAKYVSRDGKKAADRYSARPGYSEHQTGLAFDIGEVNQGKHWVSNSFGETKAGKWVAENAHRFGFIMRYPKGKDSITGYMHESWHFRYVGKEIAEDIYKRKMSFEEYLDL